ncbi:hypothetical protein K6119_06070 [Paracrocinitomix mangrovi]|uniref:hypothetical protein n=1 Tax=Paracrocinitomix mangrovi TaxID=2862509 RepID=UPI001C8EC225|nr:hypothetical protein [Paracrocinitomix mangrovi]UKN03077.1 hypothetical protein K6119_06070 [Paracrocinitomix mangrovi]
MTELKILEEAQYLEKDKRQILSQSASLLGYEMNNLQRLKFEESNRIISLNTIQRICAKYHLSFLDFRVYQKKIPTKIKKETKRIESEYKVSMDVLRVITPKEIFEYTDNDPVKIVLAKIQDGTYIMI